MAKETSAKELLQQARECARAVAKWPKAKRDTISLRPKALTPPDDLR